MAFHQMKFHRGYRQAMLAFIWLAGITGLVIGADPTGTPYTKVTIRALVVDEKEQPVAGATIYTVGYQTNPGGGAISSGGEGPRAKSDARGQASIDYAQSRLPRVQLLALKASLDDAFTAKPIVLAAPFSPEVVKLRISPNYARRLRVRAVDADGRPVAGASIQALHRGTMPGPNSRGFPKPWKSPGSAWITDSMGEFQSAKSLDPDGSYCLEISAPDCLSTKGHWKDVPDSGTIDFGQIIVSRLGSIEGRVLDKANRPVAGARILLADSRQRVVTTSAADGGFELRAAPVKPCFIFVDKTGFRFHARRCDEAGRLNMVLSEAAEAPTDVMALRSPALSISERLEMSNRLLQELLDVLAKNKVPDLRFFVYRAMAASDPVRVLRLLDTEPLQFPQRIGEIRRLTAATVLRDNFDEAKAIVDSIKDPASRCQGALDLFDALDLSKSIERKGMLEQAAISCQPLTDPGIRALYLSMVASRYAALNDWDRCKSLMREAQALVLKLPESQAGFRSETAGYLALVDLPTALDWLNRESDRFSQARGYARAARQLAGVRPAEAQAILMNQFKPGNRQWDQQRDLYMARTCARIGSIDRARATALVDSVSDPLYRARALGALAVPLAKTHPAEAKQLLDRAFAVLDELVHAGKSRFDGCFDAAIVGLSLLPSVEAVDASRVGEYFARSLALRGPNEIQVVYNAEQFAVDLAGALALAVVPYDHELALAFIDAAQANGNPSGINNGFDLLAASIADPRRAVTLVENLPDGPVRNRWRHEIAAMLAIAPERLTATIERRLALSDDD